MGRRHWVIVAAGIAALGAGPAGAQAAPEAATLAEGVTGTVTALRRLPHDGLVQLDWTVTNASGAAVTLDRLGLVGGGCAKRLGLIDFTLGYEFQVGDSAAFCAASSVAGDGGVVAPGESFEGWAWFRPPAEAVGPFAVRFGDARPILDVPLQ